MRSYRTHPAALYIQDAQEWGSGQTRNRGSLVCCSCCRISRICSWSPVTCASSGSPLRGHLGKNRLESQRGGSPIQLVFPTGWTGSAPEATTLPRCWGAERKGAQVYPPKLCQAIAEGFTRQLRTDSAAHTPSAKLDQPLFSLEILAADPDDPVEPDLDGWSCPG